jgi:GTP cyclohydrolase III
MLFERVVMARGAADVDALVKYGALLQARAQNRSDSSVHACLSVYSRSHRDALKQIRAALQDRCSAGDDKRASLAYQARPAAPPPAPATRV